MIEFIVGFVIGAIAGLVYGFKNKSTAKGANDLYEKAENNIKDRFD